MPPGSDLPRHKLEGFALYHNDRSLTPEMGERVGQRDTIDADIAWFGLRASGELESTNYGTLTYRVEGARVQGHEDKLTFVVEDQGRVVSERRRLKVHGWALDLGINWMPPVSGKPTFFLGYALGSGDADSGDFNNRAFQQTGLHDNDDQFHYYGELFDPELSNLHIVTAGVSWPLFGKGLFAIAYHHYRQVEASTVLRDAETSLDPTGEDKALGREWDLIFELDITSELSIEIIGSLFEPGRAFGEFAGQRAYNAYFELSYDF